MKYYILNASTNHELVEVRSHSCDSHAKLQKSIRSMSHKEIEGLWKAQNGSTMKDNTISSTTPLGNK